MTAPAGKRIVSARPCDDRGRPAKWFAPGIVALALSWCGFARGEAWPTAAHDNQRSGVTAEHLAPPLGLRWIFRSPAPPAKGWSQAVDGYGVRRNKSDASFDDAFRTVAANGTVYFCSSAENALYAIDAATGRVRWTWVGEAAPRLAPALHDGRLLFGADDGKVHCLRADDGRTCWVFDAAPANEKMLGYGRFSSVWPVRTGVMVEGGTAYFVAGLFPSEGLFFCAVDPATGSLLWRRQIDAEVSDGLPPQGDLLASRDSIFMTSRAMPTRWSKTEGRAMPFFTPVPNHEFRFYCGGTDARIWQDQHVVFGNECLLAYDPQKVRLDPWGRKQPGDLVFHWFNGRQVAFAGGLAYVATDYHVVCVEQSLLPQLAREECTEFEKLYKRLRVASRLNWMEEFDQTVAERGEDDARAKWIKNGPLKWSQDEWQKWPAASQEVFNKFAKKARWMTPLGPAESLVLAGRVLYVGGDRGVHAIDASDGRVLWDATTGSRVRGLAVSDGRLLVSTIDGCVRCYQAGDAPEKPVEVKPDGAAGPFATGPLPGPCQQVADEIASAWANREGYCLVIGGGDGRLARELARRSRLHIQIYDADADLAANTRRVLLPTGLHGHRIAIATGDARRLPYPPYVFNVVVDQKRLCGEGSPTPLDEALRVTRPLGGTLYEKVRHVRGKLPGTADWTHNYGTSANTYCNEDQQVKGPFGVLWYGGPGPRERIDRHATPPIPLVMDGILYTLGPDRLMAFDAYNGVKHWERKIFGAARSGLPIATSNMAAQGSSLFVVVQDRECLQLDARTGETLRTFSPPKREGAKENYWAWIATDGQVLVGSRALSDRNRADVKHSDEVFAFAIDSGKLCWQRRLGRVEHDGTALADGRLLLVEQELTADERKQAAVTVPKDNSVPNRAAVDKRGRAVPADLRKLVALDAATGRLLWERPFDATDITLDDTVVCEGRVGVACMVKDGVIVVHGTGSLGHPHQEFLKGEFARRAMYAFAADSGRYLWGGRKGYQKRPVIVGQSIYAEPSAWDLKTGRQQEVENPLSGRPQLLDFHRGYVGCSHLLASGRALFGNKPGVAYWNLDSREGFVPFENVVFGCGICATPACGVFLAPEGRSGCACPVGIHTSVALYPRQRPRAWGIGFTGGVTAVASLPVRHAAIALGAPGWREDGQKRLWVPYPSRGEAGLIGPWLPRYKHHVEQFYAVSPDVLKIEGTETPWLFCSGCRAETDLAFRLIAQGEPGANYTVRLYFAEPEDLRPGRRLFNVLLQGKTVLADFDVAGAAGGPRRAVVKEFRGTSVAGELTVGLRSSTATPERGPILCAMEAFREPAEQRAAAPGSRQP